LLDIEVAAWLVEDKYVRILQESNQDSEPLELSSRKLANFVINDVLKLEDGNQLVSKLSLVLFANNVNDFTTNNFGDLSNEFGFEGRFIIFLKQFG
jgi:pseudouridine-5'-phosphate glycosidase